MSLKQLALDLQYAKDLLEFLNDIYEKAIEIKSQQELYDDSLDQKYFRKVWNLQIKNMTSEIILKQMCNPKYHWFKLKNNFSKKKEKELTKLEKFNEFCKNINVEDLRKARENFAFNDRELIVPNSFHQKFNQRIDIAIRDIHNSPYSHVYSLYKRNIPLLRELQFDYEKECERFITQNYQSEFDDYFVERLNCFIEATEDNRVNSILFGVHSYKPETLFKNITFGNLYSIKKLIDEQKVIYDLLFESYKTQFRANNKIIYFNMLKIAKNKLDLMSFVDEIDEGTLIFEDCNSLSELNNHFSNYSETHYVLRNLLIEMKERDLIPRNVEDKLMNSDGDFSEFYKKIVTPYELNKQLRNQLSHKDVKTKVMKI